jgi:Putative prokaryotic signal transducing protein
MVHLASLTGTFEARVLAARLGAEGIVWELRGASSLYPVGRVEVLVDEEDVERARELLLVDEIEAVFDDEEGGVG